MDGKRKKPPRFLGVAPESGDPGSRNVASQSAPRPHHGQPAGETRHPDHTVLTGAEWRSIAELLHFSPRECEITQAVFDDAKEEAIAAGLGISAHTVHTHLERLYRKLGVGSRASLVVLVLAACRILWRRSDRPAP